MPALELTNDSAKPGHWETVFDIVPFPIYVVDIATLRLINVNRAMRRRTGALPEEACYEAIYGKEKPCIFCPIAEMSASAEPIGKTVVFENFNDIDDCWYQLQETLISWFDGRTAKYSIAVDISRLKEMQNALSEAHAELSLKNRELERLAVTDNLTGISNRRKLDDALTLEIDRANRYGGPFSVLLIDVDNFKMVNDTHGHQVGDIVLKTIASILKKNVRRIDTAGRWGGEEFMVVCPSTVLADAIALAEKLRQAVATYTFPAVCHTTCSFGVAQYRDGEPPEKMVTRADSALYQAKARGRNRIESESC